MRYLLDTNALSGILGQRPIAQQLLRVRSRDIGISSIVAFEAYFGAFNGGRPRENLARLERLEFEVLEFDTQDAMVAGRVRWELKSRGTPIGAYDILIAGQALARDLVLVTHNVREFSRVDGLKVEDWEGGR